MRRVWLWRLVIGLVGFAVLDVAAVKLDFAPDHVRLGLLVLLVVAVGALLLDSVADSGPAWTAEPVRPVVAPGSDAVLASYVRLVESHLTAAQPDSVLRDRLRALVDERLARRHGIGRDDPAARDLLGPALLADLSGPVRRLRRADIEEHLTRIEEL